MLAVGISNKPIRNDFEVTAAFTDQLSASVRDKGWFTSLSLEWLCGDVAFCIGRSLPLDGDICFKITWMAALHDP